MERARRPQGERPCGNSGPSVESVRLAMSVLSLGCRRHGLQITTGRVGRVPDKARYRANDAQALSSGVTRIASPEDFTSSTSTARAVLTAEPPVPHRGPDGDGDVRIAYEPPMQNLPKHTANCIHVASAFPAHKRLRGETRSNNMSRAAARFCYSVTPKYRWIMPCEM